MGCGRVWTPTVGSPLWWKAAKRAKQGYLDALGVSPQECGCEPKTFHPEAPYRIVGYNELCESFDIPLFSLTEAARLYLKLARDWSNTVVFVDKRSEGLGNKPSRVHVRLKQLAMG